MTSCSRPGIAGALVAATALACGAAPASPPPQGGRPALFTYRIVNTYPHDARAYTQGLVYRNGFLYESMGRHGESSIRKIKLEPSHRLLWRLARARGRVVVPPPVALHAVAGGQGSVDQMTPSNASYHPATATN